MKKSFTIIILLVILASCSTSSEKSSFEKPIQTKSDLIDQSAEFAKEEVLTVTEGVHVAIGFGLANSILIEGENGNIIVDCTESNTVATKVKAAFDKISNKPVKAIIYTHNHADHIFGAEVMAGTDDPDIYAHELTNYYIDRLLNVVQPIILLRSFRMFGTRLEEEAHINCGIGPRLDADENTDRSLLRPTITFDKELEVEIEGVQLKLVHAPGETNDQLFVWLPEKKTLLPGDNIYKAFPNLYTIRGTPARDVNLWAKSLDKMRYLNPEFLVPSHTRPLVGKDTIQKILLYYRDAIQFVHDQTVHHMNEGRTPDEIVELVKLPPHLSGSPYLKELYGQVDWSVRSIFTGYLGYFDGNASTLLPMARKEKANRMAQLSGGADELLQQAQNSLKENDFQWGLELTDYLQLLPVSKEEVLDIRHQCLIGLAEKTSNPNARSYYLSQALEAKGTDLNPVAKRTLQMVNNIPLESLFSAIAVYLNAEKCLDYNKKAVFHFTDVNEYWTLQIRNGVVEYQQFAMENPDLEVETTAVIWKAIVGEIKSPLAAIIKGEVKIKGGLGNFKEFMGMFQGD